MTAPESIDGFPVTCRFPVHWGEMDALGHVNNIRYFAWFETARMALFRKVGIVADRPTSTGPILATTSCDFLRPLVYPADVIVGANVRSVGNTSFVMEYGVALADAPNRLVARGRGVIVLVDYDTGDKRRVPDDVRQAIAALTPGAVAP